MKLAKSHAEKAKVGVRKARQKGMVDLKKAKSAVSEDTIHRLEKYVKIRIHSIVHDYSDSLMYCIFSCSKFQISTQPPLTACWQLRVMN